MQLKSLLLLPACTAALLFTACAPDDKGADAKTDAGATLSAVAKKTADAVQAQIPYAAQLKDAWQATQSLPSFDDIKGGKVTVDTFKSAVKQMQSVSLDKAPADIQTLYTETVKSAQNALSLTEKIPSADDLKKSMTSALSDSGLSTEKLKQSWEDVKKAFTQLGDSKEKLGDLVKKYLSAQV